MGAFRTQLEALGVGMYFDCATSAYSAGAGYSFIAPIIGVGAARIRGNFSHIPSLVHTEANLAATGDIFVGDARGGFLYSAGDVAESTLVFTARIERSLVGGSGPPYVGPDELVVPGGGSTTFNYGPTSYSNGFFQLETRASTGDGGNIAVAYFDLHVTAGDTIGIATWGKWGDLNYRTDAETPSYGPRRACYQYDTGIPAGDVLDGRPHLFVMRWRGHGQSPSISNVPVPQDNWIKLSIDGVQAPTTARGPAFGSDTGVPNLSIGSTEFDEVGAWMRPLTDPEAASLWGPSVWGAQDWPHRGSGLASFASSAESTQALTRVVDWEFQYGGQPRLPQVSTIEISSTDIDPVWEQGWADEAGTAVSYDGTRHADMGQGTWEGTDPWNSTRDRGLASKWLDMDVDIALIPVPIRGVATVYADLAALEEQDAGVSSGQSSVSGDLTVAIPLLAGEIHGSSTVYAITIGDLDALVAATSGVATVSADLSHGQTEPFAGSSSGSSSASGDLTVTRYTLVTGEEVDGNGMPMGAGGRRRSHFAPLSVGHVSDRGQGITTAGAGVGIDGIGLGS